MLGWSAERVKLLYHFYLCGYILYATGMGLGLFAEKLKAEMPWLPMEEDGSDRFPSGESTAL